MNSRANARYFAPLIAGLAAGAWAALFWLHGVSPAHHAHMHGSPPVPMFTETAANIWPEWAGPFLVGWVLMTVAMMLPTTFPLISLFRRLIRGMRSQGSMLAILVSGYLTVWFAFGLFILVLGVTVNRVAPSLMSSETGRILAPAFLLVAGVFQFLPPKRRCLERCHSPMDADIRCWTESRPLQSAFRLGLHHGCSCVGCCWALMLLMFVAGSAHMAWMMILTLAILVEKNFPWGLRLAKPMGLVLMSCAALFFIGR